MHQFKPTFREAALLDDPEMLAAVTALNRQITELAPVLNSARNGPKAEVESSNTGIPIALLSKRQSDAIYLFAVGMRDGATKAAFSLAGVNDQASVSVLGEGRTLTIQEGKFTDAFAPWDVHLYVIKTGGARPRVGD